MIKFFCIIFFLTISVQAQCKALKIASLEFPPYVYTTNGKLDGFCPLLLNEISKRSGLKFNITLYPWSRALKLAEDGGVDGIFPAIITEDRQKFLTFPKVFVIEPISLFVLSDSGISYNGKVSSVINYSFGRVRGFKTIPPLETSFKNGKIKVSEAKKSLTAIKMLENKRFDILIENEYVVSHILKNMNNAMKVVRTGKRYHSTDSYLAFNKKNVSKEVILLFNKTITEMKNDGVYYSIINNFLK